MSIFYIKEKNYIYFQRAIYGILLIVLLLFSCKEGIENPDPAIEKGIEYIEKRGAKFEAGAGLFLGFLSKKFESSEMPEFADMYDSMDVFEESASTKLYQRLVRPHRISKQDIEQYSEATSINDLQYIMLSGMYCDQITLTDDFLRKIKTQTELDGYFLTHAALSIHFAKCLKCPLSNEFKSIEKKQIQGLKKLIETTEVPNLRYEAITILKLMQPNTRIKSEWINDILDMQLEDGGWARVRQVKISNDHTTLLALWVLLESKYPDAKPVCMVR